MKRNVAFLLGILLTCMLCACNAPANSKSSTVSFYYNAEDMVHNASYGSLKTEKFNAGSFSTDYEYLISRYLEGPTKSSHTSPFPVGVKLSHFSIQDNVAHVILTNEMAALTGADLTLACACLTMTILDFTQVESVQISTESAMLNNTDYITMDASCILLVDSVK